MSHNNIDIGSLHIHKQVIADLIYSSIKDIEGVNLAKGNIFTAVAGLLGKETFPGISIKIRKSQEVLIGLQVVIIKGMNIPDIANQIQEAIRNAVESTTNVTIKEINLNVLGIERGMK